MAINANGIGQATGTNVTSLSISTQGVAAAGGQILLGIGINLNGFESLSDSVGNVYDQAAGSQTGIGAFLFRCFNNIRLPNNGTITVSNTDPFSCHMGALYISGLTSGAIAGTSAGQGSSTSPLVALDILPVNGYALCMVTVAAGSSNTFTQDPAFTSPGTFNTQTTPAISVYAGYRQVAAGGHVQWQPTLAQSATWAALMIALAP